MTLEEEMGSGVALKLSTRSFFVALTPIRPYLMISSSNGRSGSGRSHYCSGELRAADFIWSWCYCSAQERAGIHGLVAP